MRLVHVLYVAAFAWLVFVYFALDGTTGSLLLIGGIPVAVVGALHFMIDHRNKSDPTP